MNIEHKTQVVGEITAKCYDQSSLSPVWKLYNKIVSRIFKDPAKRKRYYKFGELKWSDKKFNVVCNTGFEVIGQILVGTYASAGEINYCALGTGTTTPTASDTALETETYRNATASGTASSNVTYITAFYTETETSGTFEEFGNFIDGTSTADSGKLWTHVLTGGWTKTTTDALVVDCKYTFSSS